MKMMWLHYLQFCRRWFVLFVECFPFLNHEFLCSLNYVLSLRSDVHEVWSDIKVEPHVLWCHVKLTESSILIFSLFSAYFCSFRKIRLRFWITSDALQHFTLTCLKLQHIVLLTHLGFVLEQFIHNVFHLYSNLSLLRAAKPKHNENYQVKKIQVIPELHIIFFWGRMFGRSPWCPCTFFQSAEVLERCL